MSQPATSFFVLLWRYFSFGWMLQRPAGDPWQDRVLRDANRQRLVTHLPTYIRRHLVMLAGAMALLSVSGDSLLVALPATWLGVEATLLLAMVALLVSLRFQNED